MSSGNEQTPIEGGEVQDLTTQPNFEFVANLADAVKFDDDESSNNEEHINYWKKNFLDLFKARKADQVCLFLVGKSFRGLAGGGKHFRRDFLSWQVGESIFGAIFCLRAWGLE